MLHGYLGPPRSTHNLLRCSGLGLPRALCALIFLESFERVRRSVPKNKPETKPNYSTNREDDELEPVMEDEGNCVFPSSALPDQKVNVWHPGRVGFLIDALNYCMLTVIPSDRADYLYVTSKPNHASHGVSLHSRKTK